MKKIIKIKLGEVYPSNAILVGTAEEYYPIARCFKELYCYEVDINDPEYLELEKNKIEAAYALEEEIKKRKAKRRSWKKFFGVG